MTLPQAMTAAEPRIASILPAHMSTERVMMLARMAIAKNPTIAQCEPLSVVESIIQASRLGLEIGSPIGGAHLVPFKNKCQMIVDYRALVRLALKSPDVLKVHATAVYLGETFRVIQGTNQAIIHEPHLTGVKDDANITGFYAVAKLNGGESVHEYASREEVDKIRARSRASARGPWVTDYAAMGSKTMLKRLAKWLPMHDEFGAAIEADNRADGFGSATIEGDTPASVMAQKALEAQAKLRDRLSEEEAPEEGGE